MGAGGRAICCNNRTWAAAGATFHVARRPPADIIFPRMKKNYRLP